MDPHASSKKSKARRQTLVSAKRARMGHELCRDEPRVARAPTSLGVLKSILRYVYAT
jgi:hypothetical protein